MLVLICFLKKTNVRDLTPIIKLCLYVEDGVRIKVQFKLETASSFDDDRDPTQEEGQSHEQICPIAVCELEDMQKTKEI